MLLVGLLLVALVCLVLGLALTSAVWFIASLVASAAAGFLLFRLRSTVARPAAAAEPAQPEAVETVAAAQPAEPVASTSPETPDTPVAPHTPAVPGQAAAGADEVWVIDGRPRYHLADCAIIVGQPAEPIPFAQAAEDGFMPCSLCEPSAARTSQA